MPELTADKRIELIIVASYGMRNSGKVIRSIQQVFRDGEAATWKQAERLFASEYKKAIHKGLSHPVAASFGIDALAAKARELENA